MALARAGHKIPAPDALPGGCVYEPKWDGCLHCIMRAEDYEAADNGPYVPIIQVRADVERADRVRGADSAFSCFQSAKGTDRQLW